MPTNYKSALYKQFKKWLDTQSYSANTKAPYLRIVKSLLNYLNSFGIGYLKNINHELLYNFIISRGDKKYAKAYIQLRESALDLFFAWAKKYKHCPSNPITDFRKIKLHLKPFPKKGAKLDRTTVTILTTDEQELLLDTIANRTGDFEEYIILRNKCMITLILATAIYAEELINLSIHDIDLTTGIIGINSRQNKKRSIWLDLKTRAYLKEWLFARNEALSNSANINEPLLFLSNNLNPLNKRDLHRIIANAMQLSGITKEKLGPEVLRQTAIYEMFQSGKTLEEVQEITGIATFVNLKKYLDYRP